MSKPDKRQQAWTEWSKTLTAAAQAAVRPRSGLIQFPKPVPDDDAGSAVFRASLTARARQAAERQPGPLPEDGVDTLMARYGLVECPDGEWPRMRLFKTAEGLARRLGQLENEDVAVWAFLGIPIPLSKGPQRYLLLPGDHAIQVPMYEGGPAKLVPRDLVEGLEVQDDGFLGRPELANTRIMQEKLTRSDADEDDEEDDDDDKAGSTADL